MISNICEAFVKLAETILNNEYVGLYFYSAVFQGNMALLALVGVFLVFRLQVIDQSLQNVVTGIKNLIPPFIGVGNNAEQIVETIQSYDDVYDYLKKWIQCDVNNPKEKHFFTTAYSILRNSNLLSLILNGWMLTELRLITTKMFLSPSKWVGVVILYSLLLLPCATMLHGLSKSIELLLIIVLVIIQVYALYGLYKFVLKVIVGKIGAIEKTTAEKLFGVKL